MHSVTESLYVVSLEEVLWGGLLMAISMTIHGFGMLTVLRIIHFVGQKIESKKWLILSMLPVLLASCMILFVHLAEVMVWALFFFTKGVFPNQSLAFYFSLNEYTTLGSNYNLPLQWRLLGGMIAITGLLAFAWSTGVLLTLAQKFQEQQMELYQSRKHRKFHDKSISQEKKTDSADS